MRQEM